MCFNFIKSERNENSKISHFFLTLTSYVRCYVTLYVSQKTKKNQENKNKQK